MVAEISTPRVIGTKRSYLLRKQRQEYQICLANPTKSVSIFYVFYLLAKAVLTFAVALNTASVLDLALNEKGFCFYATLPLFFFHPHYSSYRQCVETLNVVLVPFEYVRYGLMLVGKITLVTLSMVKVFKQF
jgi:hypothetical protein